jgi:hypothetical protein
MTEEDELEVLFERIVGQTIDGIGIDNDEFVMYMGDGTKIILFSDEDLQIYYELPDETH